MIWITVSLSRVGSTVSTEDLQEFSAPASRDQGSQFAVMASTATEDVISIFQRDIAPFGAGVWNPVSQQKLAKILELDTDFRSGDACPECAKENAGRLEAPWEVAPDPQADGACRINSGKRDTGSSPDLLLVRLDGEFLQEGFGNPELPLIETRDLFPKLG